MVAWAGLDPCNDWFTFKSPLFELDSRYVLHWAFVGQMCQSKAETFFFPFLKSKCSVNPSVFGLQAKTWRNVFDTDDDDADWLPG